MINRRTSMSVGASLIATSLTRGSISAQLEPTPPNSAPEIVPPSADAAPAAPVANGTVMSGDTVRQRDSRFRLPDGRWLSYREYGRRQGPLVFYFHGTPGSRVELDLCDEEVKGSGLRVVAVDRPGIGRSTFSGRRQILGWPDDVDQLAGWLGHENEPFGVIGFSGGAPYATACAYKIPHRLTYVALVSGHTPPFAGVCPGNADRLITFITRRPKLGNFAMKLADRRLQRRPDKMVRQVTAQWSAADRQLVLCDPQRYRELVHNLNEALRCGPAGLVRDVRLLGRNWGFCLGDIQGVPVSIWQGGCDRIVTPSMGRYFHEQISGSELTIDPRAGHVTTFQWHADDILSRFTG